MIPAPFRYQRASSVDEALALVAEHGDDAKFLAGGHSLLPLMKLRLAQPEVLDRHRPHLRELSYVRDDGGHIAIGALTRHDDLERSELLASRRTAARARGGPDRRPADPAPRHDRRLAGPRRPRVRPARRGPGPRTRRWSPAGRPGSGRSPSADFFLGLFETALEPDELLMEIRVPEAAAAGWSFQKFTKRGIDWAIVGVAVQGSSVALVNMASSPVRAAAVERALASGAGPRDAAAHAAEGTSPVEDINATPAYREHLARILTGRALEEAAGRAG